MTTESIIALTSTIINGAVMIGVWKLFGEYKNYNKETSWKNVKEHYDEIKIPHEVAKATEEIKNEIKEFVSKNEPKLDQLIDEHLRLMGITTHMLLLYVDKETGQHLVDEYIPDLEEAFEKVWIWHDRRNQPLNEANQD